MGHLKDKIKMSFTATAYRTKMIVKDKYIHIFGLGILGFCLFFSVALYRKVNGFDESLWMLHIFFAGLLASLGMFILREVYLFWFKKVEIPGVEQPVSAGFIVRDFYSSYAPQSFRNLAGNISSKWSKLEDFYKKSFASRYVEKLNPNYFGWVVLFCLCFL